LLAVGLTPVDFFLKSRFEPVAAAALLAAAGWYVWSWRRLRRQGRSWPARRTVSFAAAEILVAVAVFSGLGAFTRQNFSAYAALYIMVGLLAPALFAFSAPLSLALLSGDQNRARWLETRAARFLAGPEAAWLAFTASTLVLFFGGLVGDAIGNDAVRQGVYLWLVVAGWLFLWPVADVDPAPRRLGYWPRIAYFLLAFPVFTILGMGLESQSSRIAPGVSLGSLHLGAAVIWVAGETVALAGVLSVFVQWLKADERQARTHDLDHEDAAARQLALWREARDAAARAASS
jgi:putative copper resistance protein D